MPVTLTTRVEDELAKLIDEIAEREGMDRSTVIRRFLSDSARDWLIQKIWKIINMVRSLFGEPLKNVACLCGK